MGEINDQGNRGDRGNKGVGTGRKAGYEYLLAYKVTVPIYDLTVQFCNRFLSPDSPYFPDHPNRGNNRTIDQMTQAARSGMQNIVEGNKQQSLKGYIYLTGIARGSLEELLKDYLSHARQHTLRSGRKIR
jgi:hypothetical protein